MTEPRTTQLQERLSLCAQQMSWEMHGSPRSSRRGPSVPSLRFWLADNWKNQEKKPKPEALSTLIPKLWDFIVLLDRSNENKYEVAHLKSETIPFLYIVWMYLKYGFCLGANVPSSYGNRKIREQSSAGKGKKAGTGVHVCTHTKTQAHTRTQLIEGDSHFSRGELHAELHLLWGFCASLLLVYL